MTLAETLLERLNDWRPTGDGRHSQSLDLTELGWSVGLTADHVDTVGGRFWEITLRRAEERPTDLKVWAESVAHRARGLLEPLTVHEIDSTEGVALLRSDSPARRATSLAYYEVRLSANGLATIRRYQYSSEVGKREQVAFALTHEVVAKIVSDLAV